MPKIEIILSPVNRIAAKLAVVKDLGLRKALAYRGPTFGLMFGFGGIGAALLGHLADIHGIEYVYTLCSYLPLFGVLAIFLPRTKKV